MSSPEPDDEATTVEPTVAELAEAARLAVEEARARQARLDYGRLEAKLRRARDQR